MYDLDDANISPLQKARGMEVMMNIKTVCRPKVEYNEVAVYKKLVPLKGNCEHERVRIEMIFLELPDGTGAMSAMTAALIEDVKKTKCEECYIKQYSNYTEMHGFPLFVGTIQQIRYANKIRAKAHMRHGELVSKGIDNITEASWWLDNSQRMHHAKIWREVNATSLEELKEINDACKAKREKFEEARLNKALAAGKKVRP